MDYFCNIVMSLFLGGFCRLVNIMVFHIWLVLRAFPWPAGVSASVWIFKSVFHNHLQVSLTCVVSVVSLTASFPSNCCIFIVARCLGFIFTDSFLTFNYSQTSLIRTPKGQNQLSALQRCPYYRGRECMIFGFSGTKRTVRCREVSVFCRGVCKGEVRLYTLITIIKKIWTSFYIFW